MRVLIIFVIKIFILQYIVSELVEYYPSQSMLTGLKNRKRSNKVAKRQVKDDWSKNRNTSEINWRDFIQTGTAVHSDIVIVDTVEQESILNTKLKPSKRSTDSLFRGHTKTREELWNEHFLYESTAFDQTPSLIKLIHNLTLTYLTDCTPVLLYDKQIKEKESYLFQNLLKDFPVSFVHGYINEDYKLAEPKLLRAVQECIHYIVFITEVKKTGQVLGKQSGSKVIIIARSSQWSVEEFLADKESRIFINLLVIGQSFKEDDAASIEAPYILYTHKLYTDGLGSSMPIVLNSWTHGKYSRFVNLFPPKMTEGYAGHRFVVAAANQPPFVIRRVKTDADGGNPRVTWDGVEIRLLKLLAERNNFSVEIVEPRELSLGSGDAVAKEIGLGRADIGVAGMYMTSERARDMDLTFAHSQDCAVFITLMSTALPRYRAILGPFHWHVWVALTLTYLFGILPLAFSDKHTLRHLIHDTGEIENMFWYVFGTFTNCFTFVGKNSWSKTTKITTRILIGWYWIFTIIITSCYTGSIIAFVTLPIYPETVDTVQQLLKGFYRIGTLDKGGWERWFFNSSDYLTNKLMRKLELVPNVEAGIRNTTRAFFWPYAFLGSKAELQFIFQANFTATKSKRSVLHISNECFVPFGVIMGFPNNSLYTAKLSGDLMRIYQSGFIDKIVDEVRWEMQRSSTGTLLAASSSGSVKIITVEEKGLTLEDTQGMFLLLAAGFLLATTALLSEWMGGFTKRCRQWRKGRQNKQFSANSQENLITLPKSDSNNEIKMNTDGTDSRMDFNTRTMSAESRDTLEGQIIHVTEENIIIHNNSDLDGWDSRRSSSVDLDREVKEIFERDQIRRIIVTDEDVTHEDVTDFEHNVHEETSLQGAFGDHVKIKEKEYN